MGSGVVRGKMEQVIDMEKYMVSFYLVKDSCFWENIYSGKVQVTQQQSGVLLEISGVLFVEWESVSFVIFVMMIWSGKFFVSEKYPGDVKFCLGWWEKRTVGSDWRILGLTVSCGQIHLSMCRSSRKVGLVLGAAFSFLLEYPHFCHSSICN